MAGPILTKWWGQKWLSNPDIARDLAIITHVLSTEVNACAPESAAGLLVGQENLEEEHTSALLILSHMYISRHYSRHLQFSGHLVVFWGSGQ